MQSTHDWIWHRSTHAKTGKEILKNVPLSTSALDQLLSKRSPVCSEKVCPCNGYPDGDVLAHARKRLGHNRRHEPVRTHLEMNVARSPESFNEYDLSEKRIVRRL